MENGPEGTIVDCVAGRLWAVTGEGFFYVACGSSKTPLLRYRNAATVQDRPFGAFESKAGGLSASPDARSVLYVCASYPTALTVIDNFR